MPYEETVLLESIISHCDLSHNFFTSESNSFGQSEQEQSYPRKCEINEKSRKNGFTPSLKRPPKILGSD